MTILHYLRLFTFATSWEGNWGLSRGLHLVRQVDHIFTSRIVSFQARTVHFTYLESCLHLPHDEKVIEALSTWKTAKNGLGRGLHLVRQVDHIFTSRIVSFQARTVHFTYLESCLHLPHDEKVIEALSTWNTTKNGLHLMKVFPICKKKNQVELTP